MLEFASIFQDGAVLQQQKTIPVWGKSNPATLIKGEFAGQTICSKSAADGNFMLRFAAVEAGGPYTLKITDVENSESIAINDILVGEVWLASGQSNMAYRLNADDAVIKLPPKEKAFATNRVQEREYCSNIQDSCNLRFFSVAQKATGSLETTFEGKWERMTAENAPHCSAIGAWFGKYLQEKLSVPVGIIISSWGGTIAETWTSRSGLMSNPATAVLVAEYDVERAKQENWAEAAKNNDLGKFADPGNKGFDLGFAAPDFDDSSWNNFKIPGSWIRQKIAGNGAVWARKSFNLSASQLNKKYILHLGSVDKTDITYCNGVEIGRTGSGIDTTVYNQERKYPIPENILKCGKNVIAVRAYSFAFDGSLSGHPDSFCIESEDGEVVIPLAGNWLAVSEVDFGIWASSNPMAPTPGNPNAPAALFDSMLNPLIPYALRGAIWYQGESNTRSNTNAFEYFMTLKTMINDWRYQWAQGNFPFIQVQLANYNDYDAPFNDYSSWAVLRDAQRLVCQALPNVFMASAIDIGDAVDIHPQDKKSVGFRLAQNAFANVYHFSDIVPSGPLYDGYELEGNKIRIKFKYADGLHLKKDHALSFVIAGAEHIFKVADQVEIDRDSILVSSDRIPHPLAVRYAWGNNPVSSLYNSSNLPASSFRTDDWQIKD